MARRTSFSMPNILRKETRKASIDKQSKIANSLHGALHRPSRVLPTLAQSFSSMDSQNGNADFDSKLKYLDSYKNLEKITEMRIHHQQPQTPISTYLSKLSKQRLVPLPMGLIKKQGVCEKLDSSNLSMGNHYAEAMAEGLKSLKVRKVILKNNGISDQAASKLVKNLDPRYSVELNIGENYIGQLTIQSICEINSNPLSKLQTLNLESNNLFDKNISILTGSLTVYDKIRDLSLSRNKISEEGAIALAGYIKYTSTLQKLDLSWNNIRGFGGKLICKSLCENESIRVLDLSWNSLASPNEENCPKALAEMFRMNSKIVHLDISNNMLGMSDCKELRTGFLENHTILGLHIEGNHAEIDGKGYLTATEAANTYNSLNNSRIMHRTKGLKKKNKNCWICQKWNEIEFKWRNGKSGPYGEEPIMVHLDFEGFEGCELREQNDSYYRLARMCPPGPIHFYFTLKGNYCTSAEYAQINKVVKYANSEYEICNVYENTPSPSMLWIELTPKCRPREVSFHKDEIPPWDFGKSVFKDYISDSTELLNECFIEDMERSKIRELTGKEYDYLLEYLRQYFPAIKETYKFLAAKAWLDWDNWLEILIDFVTLSNMIGKNDLKVYDIENIVKTFRYWNSTTEIYFARYQFLELIVRISIMKYYRNRKVQKISQSVKFLFKNFFSVFDKQSSNDFRIEKLYTKPIDKILYRHYSTLVKLYYYFSYDNYLTFEGFYKMMLNVTKDFNIIQTSFIMSKETSVTYSYYNDSLKIVEFFEALVRIADNVKQNTSNQTRLDLFLEETIEMKLEPLLLNFNHIVQ